MDKKESRLAGTRFTIVLAGLFVLTGLVVAPALVSANVGSVSPAAAPAKKAADLQAEQLQPGMQKAQTPGNGAFPNWLQYTWQSMWQTGSTQTAAKKAADLNGNGAFPNWLQYTWQSMWQGQTAAKKAPAQPVQPQPVNPAQPIKKAAKMVA